MDIYWNAELLLYFAVPVSCFALIKLKKLIKCLLTRSYLEYVSNEIDSVTCLKTLRTNEISNSQKYLFPTSGRSFYKYVLHEKLMNYIAMMKLSNIINNGSPFSFFVKEGDWTNATN